MLNLALLALLAAPAAPDFSNELTPDWRGWESTDYAAWRDWSGLDASNLFALPDDPATTAGPFTRISTPRGAFTLDGNGDLCYTNSAIQTFLVDYGAPGGEPIHEMLVQISSPSASSAAAALEYFAVPPDSDFAAPVEVLDLSPTERAFRFRLRARGLGTAALGNVSAARVYLSGVQCLDAVIVDTRFELSGEFQPQNCPPPQPNSIGQLAGVDAGGSSAAMDNLFRLTGTGVPPGQFGYFITSQSFQWVPCAGCSQGELCISGSIARLLPAQAAGADTTIQRFVDLTAIPLSPTVPVVAGSTWHFQTWYRDVVPFGPANNFSLPQSVLFQ